MIGSAPTYHERRHAERSLLLSELKRDEARDQLQREIRHANAHARRLRRILEALG